MLLKPCKLIMDRLMKPQFTVDDVYISPFKGRRVYDANTGEVSYVPTDRNLNPTGVKVFDAYMRYIGSNNIFSLMNFTEQNGVSRPDFAYTTFCLSIHLSVDTWVASMSWQL